MNRTIVFLLGAGVGFLGASLAGVGFKSLFLGKELADRQLVAHVESIAVDSDGICSILGSGKPFVGNDNITVWSDGKRYIVGGWRVTGHGEPVFYWSGADVPSGCVHKTK